MVTWSQGRYYILKNNETIKSGISEAGKAYPSSLQHLENPLVKLNSGGCHRISVGFFIVLVEDEVPALRAEEDIGLDGVFAFDLEKYPAQRIAIRLGIGRLPGHVSERAPDIGLLILAHTIG